MTTLSLLWPLVVVIGSGLVILAVVSITAVVDALRGGPR